jgi:hypothetical protein
MVFEMLVWRVLRKVLHLKAYKLSIVQHLVLFSGYLEHQTMVKLHKPSNSECYTLWPKVLRI